MDIGTILAVAAQKYPVILLPLCFLGLLVVVGMAVVALTPSKSDDAWIDSLMNKPVIGPVLKAIASFSPVQKK